MFQTFLDHYDPIILFDKNDGSMLFKNNNFNSLIDFNIVNHSDLSDYFFSLYDEKLIPIFDVLTINSNSYLIKRRIVNNYILYHFETNNNYLNIIESIKKENSIDALTSCYTKKETELIFKRMLSGYLGYQDIFFTVVMLDIDHFKKVNDTYGHQAGDFILKKLSYVINQHLRDSDIFGRVGGEEFTILLTQTKMSGALKLTNKILQIIEKYEFNYNDTIIPLTISMGITSILKNDSYFSLVERSDKALYLAKNKGRNRIEYL